ncbi:spermidine synthase [Teredinibacter haidensis]|uniref:spermidine synthase n=1 Tax=Teredinibacter haidensis TaxID=2731755 RepID=UPI0009488C43|nr:spermidine synthase [Teredinibacter haidensis]
MSLLFEEIDSQPSPLGEVSLRRRVIPALGQDPIYEVRLGEEFLMSSMFVDAEIALATIGLASVEGEELQVVVGGLGLGYTAEAALRDPRIESLLVVDALETVIGWHRDEKVPLGTALNADGRCHYVHASFFDLAVQNSTGGFDRTQPGKRFDAILLDIDHSPTAFLNQSNASFYSTENLGAMARQLLPGGVFAMWSQDLPDENFQTLLATVFDKVEAHVVSFYNPFQNKDATNSIYVCVKS